MKIELKIIIPIVMIIIGAVAGQVLRDTSQSKDIESLQEIAVGQKQFNEKFDTYLLQQAKKAVLDSVITDSILKFMEQQTEVNRKLLE